ncbi:MAG: glycosyltransferase [Anaerolineae bacterium]|nr:glycosyltransferase [Anaerolineae bacterium]
MGAVPQVSVLIPCFNAAKTIEESLQTLVDQNHPDFEIVAVDDGSQDATLGILQAWAAQDSRVRVLPLPHGGIIAALNAGLQICQGVYVARMDADDRAHPERLARQAAYLDSHPDIALVSSLVAGFPKEQVRQGYRIYIEWLNSLVSDQDIRREIFVESPLAHPSVMFRRSAVQDLGGYHDYGWAEDYDLWLRLNLAGARFAKLPQVLLDWREHPDRLTRTDSRYSLENFLRAKAHYLVRGPLVGRDAVILWGAGMMGRRLSKHLLREGAPLVVFVDIDPRKIGNTRRGLPIIAPEDLMDWWARFQNPVVLAAVGARGARALIRKRLNDFGLSEGQDWWGVA